MSKALIRMCVEVGKEKGVRDKLRSYPEIKMAEITAGEQDVAAVMEHDTFESILSFVVEKIRPLEGIKVTWTNFILD